MGMVNRQKNLEKHCAIQSQTDSVIINQNEITDQVEINKFSFYQSWFLRKIQNLIYEIRGVFRKHTFAKANQYTNTKL